MKIRWGRTIIGAVLLEVALFAATIPVSLAFGEDAFFVAVPIACFVLGYLLARWVVRKVESNFVLHGTLVGLIATLLYLALVSMSPGSIPSVIALYGPFLFILSNVLRIAGCVLGGFAGKKGT